MCLMRNMGGAGRRRRLSRQLLEAALDQRARRRVLAERLERGGDRDRRLRAAIAEIDQRRDRVRDRAGWRRPRRRRRRPPRRPCRRRRRPAPCPSVRRRCGRRAAGRRPGARANAALSCAGDGGRKFAGRSTLCTASATLAPTPCTDLQQAKPVALGVGGEAEQPDRILAHLRLDGERRRLARGGQLLQRARRAMHDIADAIARRG